MAARTPRNGTTITAPVTKRCSALPSGGACWSGRREGCGAVVRGATATRASKTSLRQARHTVRDRNSAATRNRTARRLTVPERASEWQRSLQLPGAADTESDLAGARRPWGRAHASESRSCPGPCRTWCVRCRRSGLVFNIALLASSVPSDARLIMSACGHRRFLPRRATSLPRSRPGRDGAATCRSRHGGVRPTRSRRAVARRRRSDHGRGCAARR